MKEIIMKGRADWYVKTWVAVILLACFLTLIGSNLFMVLSLKSIEASIKNDWRPVRTYHVTLQYDVAECEHITLKDKLDELEEVIK